MRIRRIPFVIALCTVALAAVLIPSLGGTAAAAPRLTVVAGDNFFAPARTTIPRGTLVRFRWIGRRRHNVTKQRGPGRRFRSQTTRRRGVNFAKRFRKPGAYLLVCTVHPETMRLKVRVRR